jgi:hypothetical protein
MFKNIKNFFLRVFSSKNSEISQELRMEHFKKRAQDELLEHFKKTEYFEHPALMKELVYLLHYTFLILEDDYFKGYRIFRKGCTKIDDYVFSQFRKDVKLSTNIKKLNTLGFSKRFSEIPKENFLSYYVFIEEMNFELINIFNDYYSLISGKKLKSDNSEENFKDKAYPTIGTRALTSQNITNILIPRKVQKMILNDNLESKSKSSK